MSIDIPTNQYKDCFVPARSMTYVTGIFISPSILLMAALQILFNPKTSIPIQKRHPYTGNLHSGTSGDSRNAFLHWGDVLGAYFVTMHKAWQYHAGKVGRCFRCIPYHNAQGMAVPCRQAGEML